MQWLGLRVGKEEQSEYGSGNRMRIVLNVETPERRFETPKSRKL